MRTRMLSIGIVVLAFAAYADDGHNGNNNNQNNNNQNNGTSGLQAGVVGSMPGAAIGGISSGGAPWVVNQGQVQVSPDGQIQVEVQGLLIGPGGPVNFVGTTGPVTMVAASLVCGGSGGAPVLVADSSVTPAQLNGSGNAQINQSVTLPASCIAPVVLVRIFNLTQPAGSQLGPFIAASGIAPNMGQNQNNNQNQNGNHHGDGDHE
jgi:hypothetical protein